MGKLPKFETLFQIVRGSDSKLFVDQTVFLLFYLLLYLHTFLLCNTYLYIHLYTICFIIIFFTYVILYFMEYIWIWYVIKLFKIYVF